MRSIKHWANGINNYYDKGSEILPSNNQVKVYDSYTCNILIFLSEYKVIQKYNDS